MNKLLLRVLFNPKTGFEEVYSSKISKIELFSFILVPLTFIASIISIIRLNVIGVKYNSNSFEKLNFEVSLLYGVIEVILLLFGTYVSILLINGLIRAFKFLYPSDYTFRLVVFSVIPAFMGEIFFLVPILSSLSIFFQLYSLYLIYNGLKVFYKGMGDKTITVFLLIVLILLFIFTIVFGILNTIIVNVLKG
jgi:hypothetical protein